MTTEQELLTESLRLTQLTHAAGTLRAYSAAWRAFQTWSTRAGRESLPASPETVILHLTDILSQGRHVVTANQRAAAINYYHQQSDYPQPAGREVKALLRGARRDRAEQPAPKLAITLDLMRHICTATSQGETSLEIRDHAMITLGFGSALRRSSVCALDLADVTFVSQGLLVRVRREKNDQLAVGRTLGVCRGLHPETCAVSALTRWLKIRGNEPGPLFVRVRKLTALRPLNPETACRALKRSLGRIDVAAAPFGFHSLRRGFVTTAGEANVPLLAIAQQTGHRSLDSLKGYFLSAELFRASGGIGL